MAEVEVPGIRGRRPSIDSGPRGRRWRIAPLVLVAAAFLLGGAASGTLAAPSAGHAGAPIRGPALNGHGVDLTSSIARDRTTRDTPGAAIPPASVGPMRSGITPSVLDTLVLLNNTVIPGNFLAPGALEPNAVAYDPDNGELYVPDFGSNSVSVISAATDTAVATIPVGDGPAEVAYAPNVGQVYVSNQYSGTLSVISARTNTVVATMPVGSSPNGVAFDSAKNEIFVANGGSDNLTVISDLGDTYVTSLGVGSNPQGLAYDPAKGEIFVANTNSWNMSVVADSNNTVVANFLVNTNETVGYYGLPIAAAYDPGRGEIFIADEATDNVTVLNDTNFTAVATIAVGTIPVAVAYDNVTGEVYVANEYSRNVSVINDSTNTVTYSVSVGQGPVGVAYDNKTAQVFVANTATNSVNVIAPATHSVAVHITLAATPGEIAYDSGAAELFVANGDLDTVSVISDTTDTVVAQVPVGSDPYALAYDNRTGDVFVVNFGSDNVSVIADSNDTVVANVAVGYFPAAVAYDSGKGEVFVANFYSSNLTVISDATDAVVANITVGGAPDALAYDSGHGEIFVANLAGNVTVVSDASDAVVGGVGVGTYPDAVSYDPRGDVFVANEFSNNVSVIADSNNSVVANINVGSSPSALAYDRGDTVVADYGSDNVSFLADGNDSLLLNLSVGSGPEGVAFDPSTDLAYVTNVNQGTVSIVWGPSPPTSIASFTAAPSTISLGSSVRFVVGATGGTGNFSYQYVALPPGCDSADARVLVCTPTSPGTFGVKVFVNDTTGSGPDARAIATTVVTVNPHDAISAFRAAPASLSLGISTQLTVNATGGTGALSYSYSGLPPGCTTANLAILPCTPSETGSFLVNASVLDATGSGTTATLLLTVNPDAVIASATAAPATVDVDSTTTFLIVASGGTGPLSYAFTGLPAGCSSRDTSTLPCVPTTQGSFPVKVYVNDTSGRSTTAVIVLTVNPGPAAISFAATPAAINLGGSTVLQVGASGGSGALTFAFTGLPAGCASANVSTLGCTPTAVGSYEVTVYINDTAGGQSTARTALTVWAALSSASALASAASTPIGGELTLTASVACNGGTCPAGVTYLWNVNLAQATLSSATAAVTTFTAGSKTGEIAVYVAATLNGITVTSSATEITINPAPTPLAVTLSASSALLAPGGHQTFTATTLCSDGTCPAYLSYSWTISGDLGTLSTSTGPTSTFTAGTQTGALVLNVSVTLNGATVSSSANITIAPASTATAAAPGVSTLVAEGLIGALAVALVVAGVAVVMLLRRRPPGGTGPESGPARNDAPADEPH